MRLSRSYRAAGVLITGTLLSGLLTVQLSPSAIAKPVETLADPVCTTQPVPTQATKPKFAAPADDGPGDPFPDPAPNANYDAPTTPQRMQPGQEYTIPVKVTNTGKDTLARKTWSLSYRWTLPDGKPFPGAESINTALTADLATGKSAELKAVVRAPQVKDAQASLLLNWDLRNTAGAWISETDKIAPLALQVTVERETSGDLGLEKFRQFHATSTGAGGTLMVNQASGNAVWGYNPISVPGRGLSSFVRFTYNSLDHSNSVMGHGWSLSTSSINRIGSPLWFPKGDNEVRLVDGDGTLQIFRLQDGKYVHPAGVHLRLEKTTDTNAARRWKFTRPDGTVMFFDAEGYQTTVLDRNDNQLTLNYIEQTIGGRKAKMLVNVKDATGREALTLRYQQPDQRGGGHRNAGLLKSVTDLSGRTVTLSYDDGGAMRQLVDGAGTKEAKTFRFDYVGDGLGYPRLVTVTDPRGAATSLQYWVEGWALDRLATVTDRRGAKTSFGYRDLTEAGIARVESAITDPNGNRGVTVLDGYGRAEKLVNAKNETTELAWDADNNVRVLKEANGATTTFSYDPKTGFPLEIKDAEANVKNTGPTKLEYETSQDGFVGQLIAKTSPEGRRWTFGYTDKGNLASVRDPRGKDLANTFFTRYEYDKSGQLTKTIDANGNETAFGEFDATGYPKRVTDAMGCSTTASYDVRGNVLAANDAKGNTSTFDYDVFGRPLQSTTPFDKAAGRFTVTPAPVYDANDNIVQATAANGAVTKAGYDAGDLTTSVEAPKDAPNGPAKISSYGYDLIGNLLSSVEPKGTATADPNDFSSRMRYDVLNRPESIVDAAGNTSSYGYDVVGNVVSSTNARKNTAKQEYDLNHRVVRSVDPAGKATSRRYDKDGGVVSTTDAEGNTTDVVLNELLKPAEVRVPFSKKSTSVTYRTTRYEYDMVGQLVKTRSPRSVEAGKVDAFATEIEYDKLNRKRTQSAPYNAEDDVYKEKEKTFYGYDEAGNLSAVSSPASSGQTFRNVTRYTHFDNGLQRTQTDPWGIVTSWDYNELGQQVRRGLSGEGGGAERVMSWSYYPDGKLKGRADEGSPVGRSVLLVDNNNDELTTVKGDWPAVAKEASGYNGYNLRTHPKSTEDKDSFAWQLDVPQAGDYEVAVRIGGGRKDVATDAKYTVEHDGGKAEKTVDQKAGAEKWLVLGTFQYTPGQVKRITLSGKANGELLADAVRLVRDNKSDVDGERKDFGYGYDLNGNLTSLTDTTPGALIDSYAIGYDVLNRTEKVQEKFKGAVRNTTGFSYNENSALRSVTHDTQTATYEYDNRELLSKVVNAKPNGSESRISTFGYTDRGQPAWMVKGNQNRIDYEYYLNGALKKQAEKRKDGGLVAQHELSYDANGNRTKDESKVQNAEKKAELLDSVSEYTFDPQNRIRKLTRKLGADTSTEEYAHDENNNVTAQTVDGVTTKHIYDRNRLVRSEAGGAKSFTTYDTYGRLSQVTSAGKVLEKYAYDGFDRVVEQQKLKDDKLVSSKTAYDPLDRPAQKTEPGDKKTDFHYLGLSGQVISEDLNGKLDKSYAYAGNRRLAQLKYAADGAPDEVYFGYNAHSDVEQLTDSGGQSKSTYGYTAYGSDDKKLATGIDKPSITDPAKSGEAYNLYRFNAKRWDPTTGNYDMGFRSYNTSRNRFLSMDMYNGATADLNMTTDPFTNNRYAFAGGNPINRVELDGHSWFDDYIAGLNTPAPAGGGKDSAFPLPLTGPAVEAPKPLPINHTPMPAPQVSDPRAQAILNDIYARPGDRDVVGTGKVGDAYYQELVTGKQVKDTWHFNDAADQFARLSAYLEDVRKGNIKPEASVVAQVELEARELAGRFNMQDYNGGLTNHIKSDPDAYARWQKFSNTLVKAGGKAAVEHLTGAEFQSRPHKQPLRISGPRWAAGSLPALGALSVLTQTYSQGPDAALTDLFDPLGAWRASNPGQNCTFLTGCHAQPS
ncbi:hypothetical protein D5S17_30700 [Pseudonocardiaceae bacterium YIM PH 21723]|nr:hypothetical protein D5S17_30700 [Pseudonocardiaceae bacterium YIM PH 21723]